jgi:hypothetical protein
MPSSPARAVGALRPMTDPLGIYLNDHLAGATAGVELFRRSLSHVDQSRAKLLMELVQEVEEDRAALVTIMARLGIPVRHYKVLAGWTAEKLGRLKPNGHLIRGSRLGPFLEVEALLLGVRGKAAGWAALRRVASQDERLSTAELDDLLARANRQAETLESVRQHLADEAFAPDRTPR